MPTSSLIASLAGPQPCRDHSCEFYPFMGRLVATHNGLALTGQQRPAHHVNDIRIEAALTLLLTGATISNARNKAL